MIYPWCKLMKKSVDGLNLVIPKNVYDPAEDSFLLAENVVVHSNQKVLEVGSGSGYVSLYLAKKFPSAEYFCLDVNFAAAISTHQNAIRNRLNLMVYSSNLFTATKHQNNFKQFFDIILFNSPYLPLSDNGMLEKAWSGGRDGLEVIVPFIENLSMVLKSTGLVYLVVSSKTNHSKLVELFNTNNFLYKFLDKVSEGKEDIILYQLSIKS